MTPQDTHPPSENRTFSYRIKIYEKINMNVRIINIISSSTLCKWTQSIDSTTAYTLVYQIILCTNAIGGALGLKWMTVCDYKKKVIIDHISCADKLHVSLFYQFMNYSFHCENHFVDLIFQHTSIKKHFIKCHWSLGFSQCNTFMSILFQSVGQNLREK